MQSSSRIRKIKQKLRLIEINSSRQKCARSLNKSMVYCNKFDTTSDSNHVGEDSSICHGLSLLNYTKNGVFASTVEVILKAMRKTSSINLVFFMINILFLLYRNLSFFGIIASH